MLKRSLAAIAIFGAGFAVAWQIKPTPVSRSAPPLGAKDEVNAEMLVRVKPEEFPGLFAELKERSEIFDLNYREEDEFEVLVRAWYAKVPEAVLARIRALPNAEDRRKLLGFIVNGLLETDLKAALALLRQEGTNEFGVVEVSENVLTSAAETGAEPFVEICRLGLGEAGTCSGCGVRFAGDFDFKRAMDGLVAARKASGQGKDYHYLPSNLMSEWAVREPQGAWEWLQHGSAITFNGFKEFFEACAATDARTPKEMAALVASTFDDADPRDGYENAWAVLRARPTSELLESLLQAVPGERTATLDALFDEQWGGLGRKTEQKQVSGMLLERMTPAQRLEALRRNQPYLMSAEDWRAFSPVLRRLGHTDEEIRSVLPVQKEQ